MPDQFNVFIIALLFTLLIGGWLLANAMVDVAARHVRPWIAQRWGAKSPPVHRPDNLSGQDMPGGVHPTP